MLVVLSPAKKLDFESENLRDGNQVPRLLNETRHLVRVAQGLTADDLKSMMGISDALANLNVARFKAFKTPFTSANARPAIDAFKGDVYVGLDAPSLNEEQRAFANETVRILSGLYGILRPLDLMQAYRLEMGVKFKTERGANLYAFWGDLITEQLNADFARDDDPVLINLASGEYFKSIKPKALKARVITPVFQEVKEGRAKVISVFAKKARGFMARYIIDNHITNPEALKDFSIGGYGFTPQLSDDSKWVFQRAQP